MWQNRVFLLIMNDLRFICSVLFSLAFSTFTHTGRHTFCSVVTLANGVSLENIAKMVGHTNTRMTVRYAKVLDQSILRDMQGVKQSFAK
jgi:site-specific recombinase XerD